MKPLFWFVKPHSFNPLNKYLTFDRGWGNGYVALPSDHPWHMKDYYNINKIKKEWLHDAQPLLNISEDYWCIGFDTSHYRDDLNTFPKHKVIEETVFLYRQCELCKSLNRELFNTDKYFRKQKLNRILK